MDILTTEQPTAVVMVYPITPVPKPRMTQRDKWLVGTKRRPAVRRYIEFKQLCHAYRVKLFECEFEVVFVLAMPKSWSAKKKAAMVGQPHQPRPDNDNLMKALKDAVCIEDSHIWDYRISKLWGDRSLIAISKIDHDRGSLHSKLSMKLKAEHSNITQHPTTAVKRLSPGSPK